MDRLPIGSFLWYNDNIGWTTKRIHAISNDFCTMELRLDTVEAIAEHGVCFTRLSGMVRATEVEKAWIHRVVLRCCSGREMETRQ